MPLLWSRFSPLRARRRTRHSASKNFGPPVGVPFGRSIGPPTDNVEDFLGTWKISWTGSVGTNCPCQGTLTVDGAGNDELMGYWETRSGIYVLLGKVGYDQNTWTGRSRNPTIRPTFDQRAVSADDARQRKDHGVIPAGGNGNRLSRDRHPLARRPLTSNTRPCQRARKMSDKAGTNHLECLHCCATARHTDACMLARSRA